MMDPDRPVHYSVEHIVQEEAHQRGGYALRFFLAVFLIALASVGACVAAL